MKVEKSIELIDLDNYKICDEYKKSNQKISK